MKLQPYIAPALTRISKIHCVALAGGVSAEITSASGAILNVQRSGVSSVTIGDANPDFAEPHGRQLGHPNTNVSAD